MGFFVNKEELVGHVKVSAAADMELWHLKSSVTTTRESPAPLGQHILVYSRNVLAGSQERLPWPSKGAQVCCLTLKDSFLKAEQSFLMSSNQSRHDRRPAQVTKELLTELKHNVKSTQK